jgi:hypothetical protein
MQPKQGLYPAVSTIETRAEQQQEPLPVASAATASTWSSDSQPPSAIGTRTQQGILSLASAPAFTTSAVNLALTGSELLLQLTQQRRSLSSAMSANDSKMHLLLSVAPASEILLQLVQQRQGLSSAMSVTERNIQQLLPQLTVAPARNVNASTSIPVSPEMMMLQGFGGPDTGLLQLLLLRKRMQSQQALGLASAALATARNSQLQFPVAWAPAADAFASSSSGQEQILHGLSHSDPCFLQDVMQHTQFQQGLSSTAATTESDRQLQQQDLALLVSRVNAARNGMSSHLESQPAPSIRCDRADSRAAASSPTPPSLLSSGITMGLPDDNHQLSEYQIAIRQHLEIFEAKQEDVESNIQGRKRRVFLGQAGIRCRHCSNLRLRSRGRGAVYYPVKLSGMYQAAQNMARSHLSDCCSQIHPGMKQRLLDLRLRREMASGGKEYWAEAGRAIGLYETEDGLRLCPGAVLKCHSTDLTSENQL